MWKGLIEKLQKTCKSMPTKPGVIEDMKLNRLESFLLKLVIPFLRVAHCTRGSYLKVKGDLILITADIIHSIQGVRI